MMILPQFHRDVLYSIFSHVDFDSVTNVRLTCKRFRDLITIPWMESNYLVSSRDYWEEYSYLPTRYSSHDGTSTLGRLRHGETIFYAKNHPFDNLVVWYIASYRYGKRDGPFWDFFNMLRCMYRKGYRHGVSARWFPDESILIDSYFWDRRIPNNKIYHPDTDLYAYRDNTTTWISLENGGIMIKRLDPKNRNEYRVCTFNVDTKTSVVEYYNKKGNITVCLEYDVKNHRSTYRSWYNNGFLKQTGQYRGGDLNNYRIGMWTRHARNGKVIGSTSYTVEGQKVSSDHLHTW